MDVASDAIEQMLEELPDQKFIDIVSVRALVQQLIHPEAVGEVVEKAAHKVPTPPPANALGNIPAQDPF